MRLWDIMIYSEICTSDQIFELGEGAKRLQCNSNFINKIGERSNATSSNLTREAETWCPNCNSYFRTT